MCRTGAFCLRSGEIALLDGGVCTGEVSVKGNGVLPRADEYGVPYIRACGHAVGCDGMVVSRVPGRVVIASCVPAENPDEALTAAA